MKPLLIGQAPGRATDRWPALSGRTGHRFALMAGMSFDQYLTAFDRENVLYWYPGPGEGKGDAFPIGVARARARALIEKLDGRRVVFLGNAVARAFNVRDLELLQWYDLVYCDRVRFQAAVFPHPSGINRWWNDEENLVRAMEFAWLLGKPIG